ANAWWLLVTLTLFFVASTTYIIPFNALMPEMTRTSDERVRLATLQQAGFVAGIVIAASTNNLAAWLQEEFLIAEKIKSIELAIALLAVCGGIFMLIPVLVIDERKFSLAKPSHLPLREALRATTGNRNFIIYLAADFAWYMALYIIMSGLLFYVTVLVRESESLGLKLMGTMVGISLLFYPFMSYLSNRFGKKKIVLFAFFILGFVSAGIYGLGEYPVSGQVQLFTFVCLAAFPLAALGILPPAILAGIARADAEKTGENREGLYFAVKYFVVKLGQTFGIAVFATLTLLGQNVGDDFGLRLTGVVVMLLCFSALVVFSFFKGEKG
ncbi:MAG TPA: MFS transporter, partial [Bacteroidia bacterium]|nr:MFS transporter [Bacteroidia bacterium]